MREKTPTKPADAQVKSHKEKGTELTEQELGKVAGGAIYTHFDDIKGEGTTQGFSNWIT
ncbi:MAG TPA: hypothetical protein VH678_25330 [Xanthobacteraceae bacterium]|jgi:hypothetical protein